MSNPYPLKDIRPIPISALWAARALRALPHKALLEGMIATLEPCVGIFDEGEPSELEIDGRLARIVEHLEASESVIPGQIHLNVQRLTQIVRLNYFETRLLEMAAILTEDDWFQRFCLSLKATNRLQSIKAIAAMLDYPPADIALALSDTGALHLSGILPHATQSRDIPALLKLPQGKDFLLCQQAFQPFELLDGMVQCAISPKFHNLDFSHIRPTVEVLKKYISYHIKNNMRGANILIYGKSGTGKSELIRSLMRTFNRRLLEVPYVSNRLEALSPRQRLAAYLQTQACISPSQTILEFDHFEEVFQSQGTADSGISLDAKLNHGWLFRMLEHNAIPTIWITNDISTIPDDFLNRMDGVFEVHAPNSKWRTSLLNRMRRTRQIPPEAMDTGIEMAGMTPAAMDRVLRTAGLLRDSEDTEVHGHTIRLLLANFQKLRLEQKTDPRKSQNERNSEKNHPEGNAK